MPSFRQARGADSSLEVPVLTSQVVMETAARLGITPAQVALQWLLQLAPNALLIPGTGSVAHLRENLAAEGVTLDDEVLPIGRRCTMARRSVSSGMRP